ncbi:MAG: sulfotransferase family protein [Lysobacterales bacterium]|nr:MAG: sulfotransferase family protein [Xanthomonadales bacterium]
MNRTFATKSTLFETIELINSGRIGQAEAICRAAVERNDQDVNMTALLGATLFKAGQTEEAERWLRHTTALAPNFAKPWSDLGQLLLESRRPQEAVEVLEEAVRLDAQDGEAWFNLGKARAVIGRGPAADEAFEKSFALNPARKALALAAEHQHAGRWGEAEKLCREVLRGEPRNVNALRLLGTCAAHAGRQREAERLLRQAVAQAPDYAEAQLDLGRVLKEQQRLEEAIAQFEKAIELEPGNFQGHFLLASVLAPAARSYDAIDAYRKVLELRPKHPGAWLGLGHMLKTVGRQDEAIEAYRECIRLKPGNGEIYWSLANLKTYRLSDADIEEIEAQLRQEPDADDPDTQSRVNFQFALAKAWEDRGDFERAWRCYDEGNSTQRMAENYDPVRTEVLNDAIIQVFDRELLESRAGQGHPSDEPIFIVGLPRSGSTLLEQILASHSQVEGTAELPYVGIVSNSVGRNRADGVNYPHAVRGLDAAQLRQLGQDYLDLARIHRTEGRPRFIDKMPNNFPAVGLLHLVLPNAKIIDARRYPLDSCLSCYRQLFARGQSFTYDLTDIGEYFLQYQRMMDYWHQVLPGRVLTVQYEDLVTDFDSQVRCLLEFCELPFEDNCVRFWETERPVRTASSEQVRQPIYTQSIHRWRRYAHHLDELIDVLRPVLPRYSRYESINAL